MTERVIIRGRDLDVEHQADRDPKRRRPAEYVPPPPTDGPDLLETISKAAHTNPYWSVEASDWADAHPEVRPKDAAKRWRKHRIEAA